MKAHLTHKVKQYLFNKGYYKLAPPTVNTDQWWDADWFTYIDIHGEWITSH